MIWQLHYIYHEYHKMVMNLNYFIFSNLNNTEVNTSKLKFISWFNFIQFKLHSKGLHQTEFRTIMFIDPPIRQTMLPGDIEYTCTCISFMKLFFCQSCLNCANFNEMTNKFIKPDNLLHQFMSFLTGLNSRQKISDAIQTFKYIFGFLP